MKSILYRLLGCFCAVLLIASIQMQLVSAKTTNSKVSAKNLEDGLHFSLSRMPCNGQSSSLKRSYFGKSFTVRSVQNFAFTPDNRYIFTVSEGYSGKESEGIKHTILTRCTIPDQKGRGAKAVCKQAMVLKGYGHGEAIAITQPDKTIETYYIWVACKPNSIKTQRYGCNIIRLTYQVDKKGVGRIVKKVEINNFVKTGVKYEDKKSKATYVNVTHGKKATLQRVNVAVDTDSNKIAFRVCFKDGQGCYYVFYDYNKLNAALDRVKNNKTYDIAKAASYQKACIKSALRPNSAFQNFDIDDKNIYICGGHLNKGAGIYKVPYKTYKNGQTKLQKIEEESQVKQKISITPKISVKSEYGTHNLDSSTLEIEGMKIKAGKNGKVEYYINFYMQGVPIGETIGIYKFVR